jgi:3-oxoadipate enol-lactonase
MPFTTATGVSLYHETHGAGPAMVLIPGLGGDTRMFRSLVDGLEPHFTVVALDPRGAGRSDKPDVPYTVEMMAGDTVSVMDHAGLGAAHVLGVSMGGRIALALALARPERVRSLILTSTSAHTPPGGSWQRRLALSVGPHLPPFSWLYPQPAYAHRRQRQASRSYDCRGRLAAIGVPTLVAHGRGDHLVPLPLAAELAGGIPGARLSTFRGGHMFFLTRERTRFVAAVIDFATRSAGP